MGLAHSGAEQLEWLEDDLKGKSASTPIVIFSHIPLWMIAPEWGWGTEDSAQALAYLKRFGSVTVLNGHIHQLMQKVEGNVTFHTASRRRFLNRHGHGAAPGPKLVPAGELRKWLGVREVAAAFCHAHQSRRHRLGSVVRPFLMSPLALARTPLPTRSVARRALPPRGRWTFPFARVRKFVPEGLDEWSAHASRLPVREIRRRRCPCGRDLGASGEARGPARAHGDAARGETLYEACQDCHSLDKNDVGLRHRGVFGRKAASLPDYDYSDALKSANIVWNDETLDTRLTDPQVVAPGYKMFFHLDNPLVDWADVIAYLKERAKQPIVRHSRRRPHCDPGEVRPGSP